MMSVKQIKSVVWQKKDDSEYCNDKKNKKWCEFLWTKNINNQISDFQIEQNIQARATGVRCVSVWEPWIKHTRRAAPVYLSSSS